MYHLSKLGNIGILLIAMLVSISALALDGYREFKFGIDSKKLTSMKKCSVSKLLSEDETAIYVCTDLIVGGKKSAAGFYFLHDKLARVTIIVGNTESDFVTTLTALKEKYGPKYVAPNELEVQAFDIGRRSELYVEWEKENVSLSIKREMIGAIIVQVTYSVNDYNSIYEKIKSKAIKNDL